MAGLLDLFQPATPDPLGRILGASYDAEDQRWAGTSAALKAASNALLNPRQGGGGGWARAIGDIGGAMGAAGTAYGEGKIDYLKTAAEKEIAKREIERKKRLEDQEIAQDQAWADFAANLTPEQQKMVQGNPELAKALGTQWAQSQFTSAENTPDLIQEYEYAKQNGYEGSLVDYQQSKLKPPTPVKSPASIQEYEYAKKSGYKGSFTDFKLEMKGNGIIIENKDGTRTIIGGSGKGGGGTESQRRAEMLSAGMIPSVENLETTFTALGDPVNAAGKMFENIGGRFIMTSEGQQAHDSISNIVAANKYIQSGQAITAFELRQGTDEVTPYPSDSQATKDLKWARLQAIIASINKMGGNQPQPKIIGDDTTVSPPEKYDENGDPID